MPPMRKQRILTSLRVLAVIAWIIVCWVLGAAVMAQGEPATIDERTKTDFGVLFGAIVMTATVTWFVAREKTKLLDSIAAQNAQHTKEIDLRLDEHCTRIERSVEQSERRSEERVGELHRRLDKLLQLPPGVGPPEPKRR